MERKEYYINFSVNKGYKMRIRQLLIDMGEDNIQKGYLKIFDRGVYELEKELQNKKEN